MAPEAALTVDDGETTVVMMMCPTCCERMMHSLYDDDDGQTRGQFKMCRRCMAALNYLRGLHDA